MPDRSARAWAERMAVRQLPDGRYAVDTATNTTYVVDLREGACTCPDHQIRGATCKHLRRVAIEVSTRRVPPPGKRAVACANCGGETFVDRTDEAPHLCSACTLAPGDVVRDRETGDRLVVERVTDRRAHEVTIAAAETTVAAYPTNEGYPDDDLVVEAVYLGDLGEADPRVYRFPFSRLDATGDAALVP